jgi:hypothetical protein
MSIPSSCSSPVKLRARFLLRPVYGTGMGISCEGCPRFHRSHLAQRHESHSAQGPAATPPISGPSKPWAHRSIFVAQLQSHDVLAKPTSCFTEVRNVIRNGDQVTAEVTLHGLSGDNGSILQFVDRYIVVFVNSPPWQLLESTELEHWELDGNGNVIAHALLPGTTSQPPAGSHL